MFSVAVDFDGTLVEDKFPEIGEPKRDVIRLIKRLKNCGVRLILWTCRKDDNNEKHLERAVQWCKRHGLSFDAVNENLPEVQEKWGGDTRKVLADYYLDDKAVGADFMMPYLELLAEKAEREYYRKSGA